MNAHADPWGMDELSEEQWGALHDALARVMNKHADRDRSEVPVGPPLHEPTDRDADNVPSDLDRIAAQRDEFECEKDGAWAEVARLRADLDAVEDEKTALYHDRQGVIREVERLRATTARVEADLRARHPKIENPTHGCCAPPKLCQGHKPECGGRTHGLDRPPWPCGELRTLDAALRGPEPTESPEVNRFTSAQEATGATPAPLATCWSCGTATGEQHRDDCRYVSTEPTEETP